MNAKKLRETGKKILNKDKNEELKLELSGYRRAILNNDNLLGLQQRIDKAIEYINHSQNYGKEKHIYINGDDLLKILRGDE